jgi:hypothetical protein
MLTWIRAARAAVPETHAATPVSITQSLSALRLEHAHLLQEHGADRAALRQREAELADVQAREVDARATADALLHATRAAEDRATRAERTATLAEREVGFLQALNVRPWGDVRSIKANYPSTRQATRVKRPHRAQVASTRRKKNTSWSSRRWWASTRRIYERSKPKSKSSQSGPLSSKARASKPSVTNCPTRSTRCKRRVSVRRLTQYTTLP